MGLSIGEIVLILAVILLLFGAEKLPDLARSLGKALKEFKKGVKEGAEEDEIEGSKLKAQGSGKRKTGKKKK